jgi:hypothetical protein
MTTEEYDSIILNALKGKQVETIVIPRNRKRLLKKINRIYGNTKVTKYIYDSHMGGLYCSEEYRTDTYCETCGDSDWLIGTASSRPMARKMILEYCEDYRKEYLEEFLRENF